MPLSWRTAGRVRILDFDCEARPLHWIAQDYVSKEITAIAAKWIYEDQDEPFVWLLRPEDPMGSLREMLVNFRELYNMAGIVTGHYIRGFDLPLLNGAMTELELPPLAPKLAHDTKQDLLKRHGLSGSQENLGSDLGLKHPKVQMNQTRWRAANRLLLEGMVATYERVAGDVEQHVELREKLIALGYLGPPRVWQPGGMERGLAYAP